MANELAPLEGIVLNSTINSDIELSFLNAKVAPSTVEGYRKYFAEYVTYARTHGEDPLSSVTFARWRSSLVNDPYDEGKFYSANSINIRLSAVRTVVSAAAEVGYIDVGVAAAFGHVEQVKPKTRKEYARKHNRTRITPEQMRLICEAPALTQPEHYMHRALLLALAAFGGRVSEVVGLRTGDIEVTGGKVLVWVGGKHRGNDEQTPRSMSREAHKALLEWLTLRGYENAEGYIFTSRQTDEKGVHQPITRQHAWRIARGYAESVGVRHVKPHDFRRFVGTTVGAQSAKKAQVQLGHKNARTTLDNYVYDLDVAGVTDDLF